MLNKTYRPTTLQEVVGQQHIVGPNGIITNMLASKSLTSCIFYGPPGVGKSIVAEIVASSSNMTMHKFNATNASITDIKKLADNAEKNGEQILLYLDEIQYFSVKQQQPLLPYMENGTIILIAATTESPWHKIYKAIISRCSVLEFKPVPPSDIQTRIDFIAKSKAISLDQEASSAISHIAGGDVRRAINILEMAKNQYPNKTITATDIADLQPSQSMSGFDANGTVHYDLLGGLQKSIRGSDPNGAIFYLTRLLEGGDIISACRRLTVIASEDIGLAYPNAIAITHACTEQALELGLPEAGNPLAVAAILLALAPKSNSAHVAIAEARQDIQAGFGAEIPLHLQSPLFKGYKYPFDYPNNYVLQQYLPDDLVNRTYYVPGDNPNEIGLWSNLQNIKYMNSSGTDSAHGQ